MKKVIIFSLVLLLAVVITGCSNSKVTSDGEDGGDGLDCVIKGNISSSGEKIYHLPGCQSYSKTVISEEAGERWFCSENEALGAGWRKAKNCY